MFAYFMDLSHALGFILTGLLDWTVGLFLSLLLPNKIFSAESSNFLKCI